MTQSETPPVKIPTITVGLRRFGAPALPQTEGDVPPPAVSMLLGTLHARPEGGARFVFELQGDPAALRVPAPLTPAPADGLWAHTCFEVFLGVPGEDGYREFNFSPSGQWAVYEFSRYRERERVLDVAPQIRCTARDDGLTLEAELPAAALPPAATLQVGLAAVIERSDGELEYWAVHHPAERPDFHHRNGFVLILDTGLEAP